MNRIRRTSIGILITLLMAAPNHGEQVVDVAVYAPVTDQPQKMDRPAVLAGEGECLLQDRFFGKAPFPDGHVDLGEVLIDDPTCAQVHVAHLRIAHLSFGQPHVHPISQQGGMRIVFIKGIHKRGFRLCNCRYTGVRRNAPTIQDHQ